VAVNCCVPFEGRVALVGEIEMLTGDVPPPAEENPHDAVRPVIRSRRAPRQRLCIRDTTVGACCDTVMRLVPAKSSVMHTASNDELDLRSGPGRHSMKWSSMRADHQGRSMRMRQVHRPKAHLPCVRLGSKNSSRPPHGRPMWRCNKSGTMKSRAGWYSACSDLAAVTCQ